MVMDQWHLLKEFRTLYCRCSLWNLDYFFSFSCGVTTISLWPKNRLIVFFWWKAWTGGLFCHCQGAWLTCWGSISCINFYNTNLASQCLKWAPMKDKESVLPSLLTCKARIVRFYLIGSWGKCIHLCLLMFLATRAHLHVCSLKHILIR